MKFKFFFVCILSTPLVFGQLDSTHLNHNNVSAFISDAGCYFYDFDNHKKGYEVPKHSGVHALESMQFWFAVKDANGQIRMSQGGVPGQGSDVFNGPISDSLSYASSQYSELWGKSIWSICQSTIDQYTLNYNCNQNPNCTDDFPLTTLENEQIMNWPAHGDPSLGQSFYLAPFFDQAINNGSGDGFYDPSQGDVPSIKGCCATYLIQNDEAQIHTLTNTQAIGIELHLMFYQYRSWDHLNNVTFIDIKAINYSGQDYPEFVHSVAIEAALGNETDDFMGSDSTSNTLYFYNADNDDEYGPTSLGYGLNPPTIGIVALQQNISSSVPYTGNESVNEKWNLMQGLQTNGNSWLHPNGYETKFVYSGNPNNSSEWSELGEGNTPGNAKGLLSMDLGVFKDGDTLNQSYAIVYAREGNHLENVQALIDNAIDLKSFYTNESDLPCTEGTWNTKEYNNFNISIFPNPSSGVFYITNPQEQKLTISAFDLQGKLILKQSTDHQNEIKVDLSNKPPGMYLLNLKQQDKTVIKKVLVH